MSFDPLSERGIPLEKQFRNWSELNVRPYDKRTVHPFSKCRGILMNGIEVEAVMFSHNMARHTVDSKLKEQFALVRRAEAQQQKAINWLIPGDESTLEVTIGYEQVAVDLTSWIAQNEPDAYLKQVYEFGLLEDFDHLYRYANLLQLSDGTRAEELIGGLTEIMPGRPTIFEHRDPRDELRRPMTAPASDFQSILNALTVMSAEQQTMNFYMTIGNRFQEPIARGLYAEIAEIEEQHVTHYESILDPTATWLQNWVLHEYNECWLYYSCMEEEPDPRVRAVYELHLNMEIEHLRIACELLRQVENRDPTEFLPKAMPGPMVFKENKEYVRSVLAAQIDLTAKGPDFVSVDELDDEHRYFEYQAAVNEGMVPSEEIIAQARQSLGEDYRFESEGPHPVPGLVREKQRGDAATVYAEKCAA
jgi:rubrerythrin